MSYTLEKWIKPSNSICLNVTFLHFILCLIYYILEEENIEDRSQDVACFCTVWIKSGSTAQQHQDLLQILIQLELTLMMLFLVVQVQALSRVPCSQEGIGHPQEGKKPRLSLGRARRCRYQWSSQEEGWSSRLCYAPLHCECPSFLCCRLNLCCVDNTGHQSNRR